MWQTFETRNLVKRS